MSIAYHRRRRVAAMRDSFTIERPRLITSAGGDSDLDPDGPETLGPYPGEFRAVDGDELAPDIVAARGHFRLHVAVDLDVRETDAIVLDERTYQVAWVPPAGATALDRTIGLRD